MKTKKAHNFPTIKTKNANRFPAINTKKYTWFPHSEEQKVNIVYPQSRTESEHSLPTIKNKK